MKKIGIITALQSEAACLTDKKLTPGLPCAIGDRIFLSLSGMGEHAVQQATEALLNENVDGLIGFGTAGALAGDLRAGDIVLAENILTPAGDKLAASDPWRRRILQQLKNCGARVHEGNLLSSKTVITDLNAKNELHRDTAAIAVDMESAFIFSKASAHNIPAVTLRVIVDEANVILPAAILANTNSLGEPEIPGLIMAVLKQPLLLRDLMGLASAFNKAKQSMRWIGLHAEQVFLPDDRD